MDNKAQPVAMKLAEMLPASEWLGHETLAGYARECVAELLTQHARITELESQLAQRFDAADMATAAAQGFRDGAASVTNNRPSLEEVFRGLSNRAYCNYIEQMGSDVCLGWEYKSRHGMFGEAELKGHTLAGEMLGRHKAFDEAARAARTPADSVQEDAALWHWLAEYLVGTRTDLDDEIVASETVNDLRKLVEAARKQGEKQ